MKVFIISLFVILTLASVSCVGNKDYAVVSEEFYAVLPDVDVKSISVDGPFTVNVSNDNSECVTVVANQFVLDEISVKIDNNGNLFATMGNVGTINQPDKFTLSLNISSKYLKTIILSGAATCEYYPEEVCPDKGVITLNGASRLTIKGDALYAANAEIEINDAARLIAEDGTFAVQGDAVLRVLSGGSAKLDVAKFASELDISLKGASQLTLKGNQTNNTVLNKIYASGASKFEGYSFIFPKLEITAEEAAQIETAVSDYLGIKIQKSASINYRQMTTTMQLELLEVDGGSIKKVD